VSALSSWVAGDIQASVFELGSMADAPVADSSGNSAVSSRSAEGGGVLALVWLDTMFIPRH
jgi:hypothetical protein